MKDNQYIKFSSSLIRLTGFIFLGLSCFSTGQISLAQEEGTVIEKTAPQAETLEQSSDSIPSSIDSGTEEGSSEAKPSPKTKENPETVPGAKGDTQTEAVGDSEKSAGAKAETKQPVDFDAETPSWLKKRLRIGVGASLGIGTGPNSEFYSDILGFYIQSAYIASKMDVGIPARIIVSALYASHTGVNKESSEDVVVQRFLLGGGLEFAPTGDQYRFGALLSLGMSRALAADFFPNGTYKSTHAFNTALEGYVAYKLYSKINLVAGLEVAPILDYSWYGLKLGTSFTF